MSGGQSGYNQQAAFHGGRVIQFFAPVPTTANDTTTNTANPGDVVAEMTQAITPRFANSLILALFWCRSKNDQNSGTVTFSFAVGGVEQAGTRMLVESSSASDLTLAYGFKSILGLTAGVEVTVAVYFNAGSGTSTAVGDDRGFWLMEVTQ